MNQRKLLWAGLAAALLATACTEADVEPTADRDGTNDDADVAESSDVDGSGPSVLPTVASPVAVLDDIGVYYTVRDRILHVVAVDLDAREVLWEEASHPLARTTGVVQVPFVDAETNGVAVYDYDLRTRESTVSLHDLATGEERWSRPAVTAFAAPERCVAEQFLCIEGVEGMLVVDPEDAGGFERLVELDGPDRVLGQSGDIALREADDATAVELGARTVDGYDAAWKLPFERLVPEGVTTTYSSYGGWITDVDADARTSLVAVGSWDPAWLARDDDQFSADELADIATAGMLVALVDADGTPLYADAGGYACYSLPFEVDEFWTCEGVEVARIEDSDGDGTLDPEPVITRLVRRSLDAPAGDLTVTLPEPIAFYGDGMQATSDPNRYLLTGVDGSVVLLDTDTGEVADPSDARSGTADLVTACHLPGALDFSGDADPRSVEIERAPGEVESYVVVHDPLGLCDVDGRPIDDISAVIRQQPMPRWFGIGHDVRLGDDADVANSAEGWVLWTDLSFQLRIEATDFVGR